MIHRPFAIALAILACVSFAAPRCNAWNSTGHEIIALIARDQLSARSRDVLTAVLKYHPRLNEDLLHDAKKSKDRDLAIFLRAATWPDMVRYATNPMSHAESHPKWHYVDFPFDQDGMHGPQPILDWDGHADPINLLQAMDKAVNEMKDPKTPLDRKAIDLCWIEHLVGDAHQPLHATSWYSKEYPKGDEGGNFVMIRGNKNVVEPLHTYWDDIEGLSLEPDHIRKDASRIESQYPRWQFKGRAIDLSPLDWAKESFELAKPAVYQNGALPHITKDQWQADPNSAPPLPPDYATQALAAADAQVALAGYRLAALLEQLASSL